MRSIIPQYSTAVCSELLGIPDIAHTPPVSRPRAEPTCPASAGSPLRRHSWREPIRQGEDIFGRPWQSPRMRQLLLLRHAKSSWGDAALPDRDRPLSGRGRRAAAAMRQAMRDLGLIPDVILVSSARRTLETLEALEPWDDTPLVECLDALSRHVATALVHPACGGGNRAERSAHRSQSRHA